VDLQLTEKIVVITGTSSGIGPATALTVAAEGGLPILVARSSTDKLEKAKAAEIEGAGGTAYVCTADVTDSAAPNRVIATVLEQHGRVDALVNNAGGLHISTSFLDTDEQWLATFDLDFHAARGMSRAAVPATLASGGGSLVHISSDSGRLPEIGNVDYAATKLPRLALSKSLATEFSPQGVRSNVVVSGPTRTELHDRPGGFAEQAAKIWGIDKEGAVDRMAARLLTRRLGRAEGLANVIAYRVTPLSHQVTAAEWSVDGGIQRQVWFQWR
jgi:NAD(P)-dependent dehydrogenase (short-subunit alcohol dehydrogenase family)